MKTFPDPQSEDVPVPNCIIQVDAHLSFDKQATIDKALKVYMSFNLDRIGLQDPSEWSLFSSVFL